MNQSPENHPVARELRLLRATLLLCFGTAVFLIGWHIDSEICLVVGFLFLLPTLYRAITHFLRLLFKAPLIAAIREAALAPKSKPAPDDVHSSALWDFKS